MIGAINSMKIRRHLPPTFQNLKIDFLSFWKYIAKYNSYYVMQY